MDSLYFALLSLLCLVFPVLMTVAGYFLGRGSSSGLLRYIGYSSFRSRRSEEAGVFADRYTGRTMQIAGAALFVAAAIMISISAFGVIPGEVLSWFLIAEMVTMVVALLPTEIALMKRYG